jgi:hypothetical protein
MTRLINNQGHWRIEIRKSDHKAMAKIIRHNPCEFLSIEKTHKTIKISFSDCGYDGPEYASESEYRAILSKITKKPDPDLVIPREPRTESALTKNLFEYPSSPMVLQFLEEVGTMKNPKNTTFMWREEGMIVTDPNHKPQLP